MQLSGAATLTFLPFNQLDDMSPNFASALKVTLLYALFGCLWIVFSDQLLEISSPDTASLSRMQTVKGWFYVIMTSLLLFVLVSRSLATIEKLNTVDPLTRLVRHYQFRNALEIMLTQRAAGFSVVLVYLDIDDFSGINRRLGYERADQLLVEFARRLRSHFSASTLLGRLGPDQFAIAQTLPEKHDLAAELLADLRRQLILTGSVFNENLQVTMGAAFAPTDGNSDRALMAAADQALLKARSVAPGGVQFFSQELSRQEIDRQLLVQELRQAISSRRLSLVYQPQFSTQDFQVTGVEVLIRWRHAKRGFIAPDVFIPLAEEHGLIADISAFVVSQSYSELSVNGLLGSVVPRVSINISALEFNSPTLLDALIEGIEAVGRFNSCLQIEITETAAFANLRLGAMAMARLKGHGLCFSVDDFGTGYSSLSMIKSLPIDEIKIDRSFVNDLDSEPKAGAIVAALVTLAAGLRVGMVAEGVETQEQLDSLTRLGCREVQGYLLAVPMTITQLVEFLADTSTGSPRDWR